MADRKWEQAKDEAAAATQHTKEAAAMKWDETKDSAYQKKEEIKQDVNRVANKAEQKVEGAARDVKAAARDVSNAASDKWEETKYTADVKSKELAGAAIDKTRRATDNVDNAIQAKLDRAEAHVDDQKSFVEQTTEQAAYLAHSAKEGALYAASVVGSGLVVAAEGAAHLASAAYDKVSTAVDSAIHPAPVVAPPAADAENGSYYKKEEVTISKPSAGQRKN
ncbi:hypothetical protein BV898_09692 [Hypsibius exemplaris]|uniref:Uncharacterized protein n=1 Tax=Hypsibius exemplaris TaxID=2072580 RepID=A0A1W0WLX8_HYPEX|nr:hypothetical protein BV898_09692 [Hypsibius exemplaris]